VTTDVTVCVPTIPPRVPFLVRALASVWSQTVPIAAVAVAVDHAHEGVWVTRRRAHLMATTPWVANLDDDDELYPFHVEHLRAHADRTGADLVFPWFETVPPGGDVLGHFGKPFDPANPHLTTSTVLLRTELAHQLDLGPPEPDEINANDDMRMVWSAVALDAKIVHLPERTWRWHQHGHHTSGQPHRW
jgi:hypothetical protein